MTALGTRARFRVFVIVSRGVLEKVFRLLQMIVTEREHEQLLSRQRRLRSFRFGGFQKKGSNDKS